MLVPSFSITVTISAYLNFSWQPVPWSWNDEYSVERESKSRPPLG